MIDTPGLQTLISIAKFKSFSKAAEEVGVTQSAISQSIKNLEKKVGVKLINRKGKNIALTHEGLKLCYLGKDFFKKYDIVMSQIYQEKNTVMGKLSVGTLTGVGKSWVASKMIDFAVAYPDLEIQVIMDFPENLQKKFENNELDALIVPDYHVPLSAERLELQNEFTTLVFPDSAEFNITEETDLKSLSKFPVIFFEENDPLFSRWCREKFKGVPRNIKPRLVVNSFGHMLKAVHEGLGVAVVPGHVLARSYFSDKVKTLGPKFQVENDKFFFAYHEAALELLKVRTLYDFLKDAIISIQ